MRALWAAGLPRAVLQLLPGRGETVGAALVADARTAGVCFTGSTAVARAINRTLADRPGAIVPLIAETGGLNAMVVERVRLYLTRLDGLMPGSDRVAQMHRYYRETVCDACAEADREAKRQARKQRRETA
mgnify:CR=1 FL=1